MNPSTVKDFLEQMKARYKPCEWYHQRVSNLLGRRVLHAPDEQAVAVLFEGTEQAYQKHAQRQQELEEMSVLGEAEQQLGRQMVLLLDLLEYGGLIEGSAENHSSADVLTQNPLVERYKKREVN